MTAVVRWVRLMREAERVAKALVAFFVPGAVILIDAIHRDTGLPTESDWLLAVLTAVVTSGAVYATPNRRDRGQ